MRFVLLLILLSLLYSGLCKKKKREKGSSKEGNILVKSVGFHYEIETKDVHAIRKLKEYAESIDTYGGFLPHYMAVAREQEVVTLVEQNIWPISAYESYQKLAAGTGNVDSARLLMDYGIMSNQFTTTNPYKSLFQSTQACDYDEFKEYFITNIEDISVDLTADNGMTLLSLATSYNCTEIVSLLLEYEADVELTGSNGLTPLMIAASKGHTNIIDLLVLGGGANVNAIHKFASSTSLHFAAELGQYKSLSLLCAHGANSNLLTSTGSTALHSFAHGGADTIDEVTAKNVINSLVNDCKIDINVLMNGDSTALYLAAQHGKNSILKALLRHGADVNFAMPFTTYKGGQQLVNSNSPLSSYLYSNSFLVNSEVGNGATALHAAVEEGHVQATKILLDFNADINTIAMGVTPLSLACQYNRYDVVALLVSYKTIEVDKTSTLDGTTPLYTAAAKGYSKIVSKLLESNADPTITAFSGGFPLLISVISGSTQTTRLLLESKRADVNQVAVATGDNALSAAITIGNTDILKLLIKNNANLYLDSASGYSPIHLACQQRDATAAKLLLAEDIKLLNFPSKVSGLYPLMIAVEAERALVVKYLLSYDECSRDQSVMINGKSITPLLLAIDKNNKDIVQLLLEAKAKVDVGIPNSGVLSSPLLFAVVKNYSNIVKMLLDYDANCNVMVVSSDGARQDSLVDIARNRRHHDTLQILLKRKNCQSVY
jgi:ankyrin repeat protein